MAENSTRLKADQWIQNRRRVLAQLKRQVLMHVGPDPHEITRLRAPLAKRLRQPWRAIRKEALIDDLTHAQIIYGGDFHAHGQVQRTHLRILRSLVERGVRPSLAMEAIAQSYQAHLDKYLQGKISLEKLKRLLNWESEWGFPWEDYAALLIFAREHQLPILALNSSGRNQGRQLRRTSLAVRERSAARVIATHMAQFQSPIYVLFGGLHVIPSRLPFEVNRRLNTKPRFRILYVNSDEIYFKLAQQRREHRVDAVRLSRNEYCLLSSPPWVQWQSYLMHLENTADVGLKEDDELSLVDFSPQIASAIALLKEDLKINKSAEDLTVISSRDHELFWKLQEGLKPAEKTALKHAMETDRSYFLPSTQLLYLARPTINHVAELAGLYLHSQLSGRTRLLVKMPRDFAALIWVEAVGFFASKLVNHKRQAGTLADLQSQLASLHPGDRGREALRLALDQRLSELQLLRFQKRRPRRVRPRRKVSFFEAARILGTLTGERLYLLFRSRKISVSQLRAWMQLDVEDSQFPLEYERILSALGPKLEGPRGRLERL